MNVYEYFEGDKNKILIDMQFEMYNNSKSTMFQIIKDIFKNSRQPTEYLESEENEKINMIEKYNNRFIEEPHDVIAAIFRFNAMNNYLEKDLLVHENRQIKSYFSDIYTDTKFLDIIPEKIWPFAYKWHKYLIDYLKENISLVNTLILATLRNNGGHDEGMARAEVESSVRIIREQHSEIPWIVKYPYRCETDQKVVYTLYDYSEKCVIGYCGIAYHKGYIIFFNDYLRIEDNEVDRDDWDDLWCGKHSRYKITSDKYDDLILLLSEEYQQINIETETKTNINIYNSLKTQSEKDLFKLLLSVIEQEKGIPYGGWLVRTICKNKIKYDIDRCKFDDFYPDCDICNYDEQEVVNG